MIQQEHNKLVFVSTFSYCPVTGPNRGIFKHKQATGYFQLLQACLADKPNFEEVKNYLKRLLGAEKLAILLECNAHPPTPHT